MLGIYSILITNQQQFFVKDTIKYCSIPSVPSGLEEVKTHPEDWSILTGRITPVTLAIPVLFL